MNLDWGVPGASSPRNSTGISFPPSEPQTTQPKTSGSGYYQAETTFTTSTPIYDDPSQTWAFLGVHCGVVRLIGTDVHVTGGWVGCQIDDKTSQLKSMTEGGCAASQDSSAPNNCEAEPVTLATGEYSNTATDVALASPGIPLSIVRTYNSQDPNAGAFGSGWSSTLPSPSSGPRLFSLPNPKATGLIRRLGSNDPLLIGDCWPNFPSFTAPGAGPPPPDPVCGPESVGGIEDTAPLGAPKQNQPILFSAPDGKLVPFDLGSNGTWSPPTTSADTLVATGSGYSLTRPDGEVMAFDAKGDLVSWADRNCLGVSYSYNPQGQVSQITGAAGRSISFDYSAGLLASASTSDGRSVHYGYTDGLLTSVTDTRGNTTSYGYDPSGRLATITDQDTNTIVTNSYDELGRVIAQTDGDNNTSYFAYASTSDSATSTYTDALGHSWVYSFSGNLLQSKTDPLGNTTSYTYNANLDLASVTDGRSKTWSATYDDAHNRVELQGPAGTGIDEKWTYNGLHEPTSFTDSLGNLTNYGYTQGNLTSVDAPGPADTAIARQPVSCQSPSSGAPAATTNANGHTTTYGYNASGQLASVTDALGHRTTMAYDAAGRLRFLVDPRGNETGADPAQYRWAFGYNEADQPTSVTDPLGDASSTSYLPSGRIASRKDANGNTTSYAYDPAGRISSVRAPDGGTTSYAYDLAGRLIAKTDANRNTTTYGYDDANRVTSTALPMGQTWSYGYDPAGDLATSLDPNGVTTTRTFDNAGRLVNIDYSDATSDVAFTYDKDSNRTAMTDGQGTETYSFDALNRLTSAARGTQSFSYSYDPAGNITRRVYPDGTTTDYAYNDNEQMRTATVAGQTTTYRYNAAGMLERTGLPNGVTQDASYDAAGRMSAISAAAPSGPIANFSYTLDPVGNPLTQAASYQGGPVQTTAFGYDSANRLTDVCATACPNPLDFTHYSYDRVGNRTAVDTPAGTTAYGYDANDELLGLNGPDGPETFGYDANGNQTIDNRFAMTYDAAGNRLTEVGWGLPRQTHYRSVYSYDGMGNRVTTRASATSPAGGGPNYAFTTQASWDQNYSLPQLASEAVDNGPSTDYMYGMGRISEQIPGSGEHYYSTDRMGSVTALTGQAGAIEATYSYSAFGQATRTDLSGSAPANPFAFTGEYFDTPGGGPALDGLYNLRARQYDPTTGRFLQRDPIPSVGSAYAYVGDRPTVMTDSSGRCGESPQTTAASLSQLPTPSPSPSPSPPPVATGPPTCNMGLITILGIVGVLPAIAGILLEQPALIGVTYAAETAVGYLAVAEGC